MEQVHFYRCGTHEDSRGSLISLEDEIIRKNMKHLFISYTKPDMALIRGGHYHRYKNEWFYIIKGMAELKVKDLKTGKQEEYVLNDKFRQFVHIKPNLLHSINNIGKTELILLAIVDRKFNPKKPDTYET